MHKEHVRRFVEEIRKEHIEGSSSRMLLLKEASAICNNNGLPACNQRWWRRMTRDRVFPSVKVGRYMVREDYVRRLCTLVSEEAA